MQRISAYLLVISCLGGTISCLDDEVPEATALTIVSIDARGTKLLGGGDTSVVLMRGSSDMEIPHDSEFSVTFSKVLAPSVANLKNFTIERIDGDRTSYQYTSIVSGTSRTVTPVSVLPRSAVIRLSSSDSTIALDGGISEELLDLTFRTTGTPVVTPPQSDRQVLYFNMNDDFSAPSGTEDINLTSITSTADKSNYINSAFSFDGNTSIVDYPLTKALPDDFFTLSFWVKVDTINHTNTIKDSLPIQSGHLVMGIGGEQGFFVRVSPHLDTITFAAEYRLGNSEVRYDDFNYLGGTDIGNEAVEVVVNESLGDTTALNTLLTADWAHIVVTYDGSTNERSMYINGLLKRMEDLDLTSDLSSVASLDLGPPDLVRLSDFPLTFGFAFADLEQIWCDSIPFSDVNADHFKGALDEVRLFDISFSPQEVELLYSLEKP